MYINITWNKSNSQYNIIFVLHSIYSNRTGYCTINLMLSTVNNNINITWVALSDKYGVNECVSIGQPMTHQQTFVSRCKSRCITVLHNCFTTWVYTPKYFHTVWEFISDTKKILFYSSNINPVNLCCWLESVQRFHVWG